MMNPNVKQRSILLEFDGDGELVMPTPPPPEDPFAPGEWQDFMNLKPVWFRRAAKSLADWVAILELPDCEPEAFPTFGEEADFPLNVQAVWKAMRDCGFTDDQISRWLVDPNDTVAKNLKAGYRWMRLSLREACA